jgi:hypothetical protein
MSLRGSPTLQLDVSARLLEPWAAVAMISAAVTMPLLMSDISGFFAVVWGCVSACAVGWGLTRHGWIGGTRRIKRVTWQADGQWVLTDGADHSFPVNLDPNTRMVGGLLWLRWRAPGSSRAFFMLIGPRDLPQADFRRLTVRLSLAARFTEPFAATPAR